MIAVLERGETTAMMTPARAARELGLRPREWELAVELEEVETVRDPGTGRRRVRRTEVDRLRNAEGFPGRLRDSLRVVGAMEGARLFGISAGRFARLARGGCFTPVRFSVNRYRAVVWRYAAQELEVFGEQRPELLTGRTPPGLRDLLAEGADLRPRQWRGRRAGQLAREAHGPWERAAARAAVLGPGTLRAAVPEAGERARLAALKPALVAVRSPSPAMRAAIEDLSTADGEQEIRWLRLMLAADLEAARAVGVPQPGQRAVAGPGAPTPERSARRGPRRGGPGRWPRRLGPGPRAGTRRAVTTGRQR